MPLQNIHLRKFLKVGFSNASRRRSELRADIRQEIAREAQADSGGGDFYVPFWADAKAHALVPGIYGRPFGSASLLMGDELLFTHGLGMAFCSGGTSGGG